MLNPPYIRRAPCAVVVPRTVCHRLIQSELAKCNCVDLGTISGSTYRSGASTFSFFDTSLAGLDVHCSTGCIKTFDVGIEHQATCEGTPDSVKRVNDDSWLTSRIPSHKQKIVEKIFVGASLHPEVIWEQA